MKKQRGRRPVPQRKSNETKAEIKRRRRIEAEADLLGQVARVIAGIRAAEARMPPEVQAEYRYLLKHASQQPDGDWPEDSAEAMRLEELDYQYMDLVTDAEIDEQLSLVVQELADDAIAREPGEPAGRMA